MLECQECHPLAHICIPPCEFQKQRTLFLSLLICSAVLACHAHNQEQSASHSASLTRNKRGITDFLYRFWNGRKKGYNSSGNREVKFRAMMVLGLLSFILDNFSSSSSFALKPQAQAQTASAPNAYSMYNQDFLLQQAAANMYPSVFQQPNSQQQYINLRPSSQFLPGNQFSYGQEQQGPQYQFVNPQAQGASSYGQQPALGGGDMNSEGSSLQAQQSAYYYPQGQQQQQQQFNGNQDQYAGYDQQADASQQQQYQEQGQDPSVQYQNAAGAVQPDESIQRPNYVYSQAPNQYPSSNYRPQTPSQSQTFASRPYGPGPGSIDVHQVLDQFIRSAGLSPQGDHDSVRGDNSFAESQTKPVFSLKKLYSYPFYMSASGDKPINR